MKIWTPVCGVLIVLPILALADPMVTPVETGEKAMAAPAESTSGIDMLSAGVGTGVENRELLGEATQFDTSVTKLYCLTKIQASATPTAVKHVWSVDGKVVNEIPLDVKGSPWRTWSVKTVWAGHWTVEVQDEAGTVLKTLKATVAETAAP